MNKQEAFDKAARGVIAQGGPSLTDDGCRYRQGNRCCGVGHLLIDDPMRDRWDNNNWSIRNLDMDGVDPRAQKDMEKAGIADLPLNFLQGLQDAHDNAEQYSGGFLDSFRLLMRRFAETWSLNTEVLDA